VDPADDQVAVLFAVAVMLEAAAGKLDFNAHALPTAGPTSRMASHPAISQ
jgi:hypothetical protein